MKTREITGRNGLIVAVTGEGATAQLHYRYDDGRCDEDEPQWQSTPFQLADVPGSAAASSAAILRHVQAWID